MLESNRRLVVGGEILDMALGRAKPFARFVMCGGISQYNTKEVKGPKVSRFQEMALFGNREVETDVGQNILNVVTMRIKMQGFIVFDFAKEYPEGRKDLARWLEEGKIKRKETIVKGGLKAAEEALVGLYKG